MNTCGCCDPNIFNEGELAGPMASARINIALAAPQTLLPIDPNPSYVILEYGPTQGLYDYNDNGGLWTLTNPTTITINKTGNYGIGWLMNLYNGVGPGTVVCQIHNLVQGAIGAVPPICSTQNILTNSPVLQPGFFVSVESAYSNAFLVSGSLLRITYITDVICEVSPTSAISITLLEGAPGAPGMPGPAGVSQNIYNVDGTQTDPLRTVSLNSQHLDFDGGLGGTFSLNVDNFQLTAVPLNDNSLTSVLVRDPGVGLIKYRTIPIGPTNTIYSADDTLAGPRTVTLGPFGNDLQFQMINNKFVVKSAGSNLTADGLASTLSAAFTTSITADSPTILLSQLPQLDNTQTNILVRNSISGRLEHRTVASLPGGGPTIYSASAFITGNRTVDMNGNNLEFLTTGNNFFRIYNALGGPTQPLFQVDSNGAGLIRISAVQTFLTQVPQLDNTQTDLLVRNSVSGRIERRTVASLPGGGGPTIFTSGGTIPFSSIITTPSDFEFNGVVGGRIRLAGNGALVEVSAPTQTVTLTAPNIIMGASSNITLSPAPTIDNITTVSVLAVNNANQVRRRLISSLPNIYNSSGLLTSNRALDQNGFSLFIDARANTFSIAGTNVNFAMDNAASNMTLWSPKITLTSQPPSAFLDTPAAQFDILRRNRTTGEVITVNAHELPDFHDFIAGDQGVMDVANHYYYCSKLSYPSTANGPLTAQGTELLCRGWYLGFTPNRLQYSFNYGTGTTVPTLGSGTIELWRITCGPGPGTTAVGTGVLVFSDPFSYGGGFFAIGGNTSMLPAPNNDLWTIVIKTDATLKDIIGRGRISLYRQ